MHLLAKTQQSQRISGCILILRDDMMFSFNDKRIIQAEIRLITENIVIE